MPAVCGSCGAPLAFMPGEQSVACGHCRSVVVASRGHGHQLIELALAQSQRGGAGSGARGTQTRARRASARRRTTLMASLLIYGACGMVFVPAFLLATPCAPSPAAQSSRCWTWRRDLRGDFHAGWKACSSGWMRTGSGQRRRTHAIPGGIGRAAGKPLVRLRRVPRPTGAAARMDGNHGPRAPPLSAGVAPPAAGRDTIARAPGRLPRNGLANADSSTCSTIWRCAARAEHVAGSLRHRAGIRAGASGLRAGRRALTLTEIRL